MIDFKNVSYTYPHQSEAALRNINLHVGRGETLLLTGASGCGKSTLGRIVNGLIPEHFAGTLSGQVLIDGKELRDHAFHDLTQIVGSLFQDPEQQFLSTTVNDELRTALEWRGLSALEIDDALNPVIDRLGLRAKIEDSLFTLSEGEKQKVVLASVLALKPRVLMLDEPTANLDPAAVAELCEILMELKQEGLTLVIFDHRLYWLESLVDHVGILEDGCLVETGDFQTLEKHRDRFGLRATGGGGGMSNVEQGISNVEGNPREREGISNIEQGMSNVEGNPGEREGISNIEQGMSNVEGNPREREGISNIEQGISNVEGNPTERGISNIEQEISNVEGNPTERGIIPSAVPCSTFDIRYSLPSSPSAVPCSKFDIRNSPSLPSGFGFHVSALSFAYPRKEPLFETLSLHFPAGKITALCGTNGCGKTTLARLMIGLEKPKSGAFQLNGESLAGRDLLKKSSLVLQNTELQLYMRSVEEELTSAASAAGTPLDVAEVLENFQLSDTRSRHPQSLSGGQRQRLVIACALLKNPKLLILDEPTSGLDGRNMRLLAGQIRAAAERGAVVIVITHDHELINECCDSILTLFPNIGTPSSRFTQRPRSRPSATKEDVL